MKLEFGVFPCELLLLLFPVDTCLAEDPGCNEFFIRFLVFVVFLQ
jgi:hypothetical protein